MVIKMTKIDIESLKSEDIKQELSRIKYKSKFSSILRSTIYVLITLIALGTIIATFLTPIIQINTNSMSPKYNTGDVVVTLKTKNIKKGDIIAFYHGNKIIVSRVIGLSGEYISIDSKGIISINGEKQKEEYATNIDKELDDIKYPHQVSSSSYFVLNDDREYLNDSRNKEIGDIKSEDLIGKLIFKIWSKK